MCHRRHIPSSLRHGSSCILNIHTPQYWRQTICPSSDPVPHCMAMWRHNKRNLYQCIRTLSNFTVCRNSSRWIDSVERRLLVHVSRPHEPNENVIWMCLSLEVFLSIPVDIKVDLSEYTGVRQELFVILDGCNGQTFGCVSDIAKKEPQRLSFSNKN